MTNEEEARILRKVAKVLLDNYEPGYYGMGGPQDGDDIPPEFDGKRAAEQLNKMALELEKAND